MLLFNISFRLAFIHTESIIIKFISFEKWLKTAIGTILVVYIKFSNQMKLKTFKLIIIKSKANDNQTKETSFSNRTRSKNFIMPPMINYYKLYFLHLITSFSALFNFHYLDNVRNMMNLQFILSIILILIFISILNLYDEYKIIIKITNY